MRYGSGNCFFLFRSWSARRTTFSNVSKTSRNERSTGTNTMWYHSRIKWAKEGTSLRPAYVKGARSSLGLKLFWVEICVFHSTYKNMTLSRISLYRNTVHDQRGCSSWTYDYIVYSETRTSWFLSKQCQRLLTVVFYYVLYTGRTLQVCRYYAMCCE